MLEIGIPVDRLNYLSDSAMGSNPYRLTTSMAFALLKCPVDVWFRPTGRTGVLSGQTLKALNKKMLLNGEPSENGRYVEYYLNNLGHAERKRLALRLGLRL